MRQVDRVFKPDVTEETKYQEVFEAWQRAVGRLLNWYEAA